MSGVYDNWNRLVEAVLRREELRQLAYCESLSPSVSDDFSSRCSLDSSLEDAAVGNSSTAAIAEANTTAVGNSSTIARLFAAPAVAFAQYRRGKQRAYLVDVAADVPMRQLQRFSLRELQVATDNFSNKNFHATGRFGTFYKGRLADGSLVAVCRLKEGKKRQFETEVEATNKAVHRNLIRLHGFCIMPKERLLVYPFFANGSVGSWLRERPESRPPLDWPRRKRIALGSATGLAYLHDHCNPKIIHRNVKAATLLLDKDFEAVIGDFALAIFMDYNNTHVTTAVRGTMGHIAPEYLSDGECSEKTDVFSYGVMLLELITGQRAFSLARLANNDNFMLLDWVKGLVKDKKLKTLVDPNLQGNIIDEVVEQLIQVALLCTQSSPMERPKMSEVVRMLQGDGLAERWEKCQKEEIFRQDFNHKQHS